MKGQRGSRPLVDVGYGNMEGHRARKHVSRSDVESWIKPAGQGVYASQRLSFGAAGKGPRGTEAKVANRTRESRPSGMKTGASGNVTMGVGLRAMTKVMESPPNPTVRAPEIYPNDAVVSVLEDGWAPVDQVQARRGRARTCGSEQRAQARYCQAKATKRGGKGGSKSDLVIVPEKQGNASQRTLWREGQDVSRNFWRERCREHRVP